MTRLQLSLLLAGVAAAAILAFAGKAYLDGRASMRPKVEVATDRAAVASQEAAGGREQAARLDVYVNQREAAYAASARLAQEAYRASDASTPLDPDRAARLRAADRELCALNPASCTAH